MRDTISPNRSQPSWSPSEMAGENQQEAKKGFLQRWYQLTAIPNVPNSAPFVERERVRKSQLTSFVLLFFTVMIASLIPACIFAISIYPTYIWLMLFLSCACVVALVLNRRGQTIAAGILVNVAAFAALTAALFSTVPFDETTLQGYDMYVVVELLAVSLLPPRSVFVVFVASVGCIVGTLFGGFVEHTQVLQNDLANRWFIIVARPAGTLLLVAGVAYILSTTLSAAIRRANQAEMIAKLEHELADQKQELEAGIQQILNTHVEVANGNLNARAPLTQDNVLWQIARALNTLLVRYQRAEQAEREMNRLQEAVHRTVNIIQQADARRQNAVLPLTKTLIDPIIAALQGHTLGTAPLQTPKTNRLSPNTPNQQRDGFDFPPFDQR